LKRQTHAHHANIDETTHHSFSSAAGWKQHSRQKGGKRQQSLAVWLDEHSAAAAVGNIRLHGRMNERRIK